MTHVKLLLLGLGAGAIGMTMSASLAQGATLSWLVLNSSHTTATELKAELSGKQDSEHLTVDAEVAGITIAVTCTNFILKGFNLEAGGKLTEGGKIVFTGCKVYKKIPLSEEFKCTAKSPGAAVGTIETGELKGELTLVESELQLKIQPKAGPTGAWKTIRFEGAECPLPETNQVHGTVFAKDGQGFATAHKLEHLLEPAKQTALYIGGHSEKQLAVTKLLGSFWVKLAGAHAGLEWSGMDV